MALNGFQGFSDNPVLLVCRVARGNVRNIGHLYSNQDERLQLGPHENSIFRRGSNFAATADETIDVDGVEMCSGRIGNVFGKKRFDDYNKYMVQESNQVKFGYIMQLEKIVDGK